MKLGFLGTGKMASAIAAGAIANGVWRPDDIVGFDVSRGHLDAFLAATGAMPAVSAEELAAASDVVIIAVKPQNLPEAITICGTAAWAERLVISIAAGTPLKKLHNWIGHKRIVRVMPNTPAMVGRGASVFACDVSTTTTDRAVVTRILNGVGLALEMDEPMLDAVTALSGSGPAYVFELIQALVAGAMRLGLEHDTALKLTVQTIAGATEMVGRGLGTPEELRDAVTSPGGTTAAGLAVMKEHNFRDIIAEVLRAARDRSLALSQIG